MTAYAEIPDPLNPRMIHGIPSGEEDLHDVSAWCDCGPTFTAVKELGAAAVVHRSMACPDTIPEDFDGA